MLSSNPITREVGKVVEVPGVAEEDLWVCYENKTRLLKWKLVFFNKG